MDAKFLIVILIAINCYSSCGAALRRTPKVYNALITTDENLTSSRAYPVIQPTIHETGVAHYPFSPYNHYGYGPYGAPPLVRFGQPIAPGFAPREPLPYPLPYNDLPPQTLPQGFQGYPGHNPPTAPPAPEPPVQQPPQQPPTAPPAPEQQQPQQPPTPQEQQQQSAEPSPAEQQESVQPPSSIPQAPGPNYMSIEENRPQQMPNEKLPLPLNEFGLPPALIPLPQYGQAAPNRHSDPVQQLPSSPYGYNQYPLIYDPVAAYREQYLPPYEYYPSPQTFAVAPQTHPKYQSSRPQPILSAPLTPAPPTDADEAAAAETDRDATLSQESTEPSFESIRNGSNNKDSGIPDVPPPPIPSGAKSKQS